MTKVIINVSDTMGGFVTKTNLISTYVGDLATLNTTQDSDLVGAINEVFGLIDSDIDFRSKISVTDAGGDGSLSYNSSTGIVTYTGPSASEVRAHFAASHGIQLVAGVISIDSSEVLSLISAGEGIDISSGAISGEDATVTNKGIASFSATNFAVVSGAVTVKADGISSTELKDLTTILIKNAAGTTLKTLHGAGS